MSTGAFKKVLRIDVLPETDLYIYIYLMGTFILEME